MLIRKLQQYGKDSLGVTLPRQYLRSVGIEKGDEVQIQITANGSMIIIPVKKNNQNERPGVSPDALREVTPTSKQEGSSS